jgi:hypothetical protein
MPSSTPFPIRFTEEDQEIIADLRGRTAMTTPALIRYALRNLRDHMDATSPRKRATRRAKGGRR